MNVVYDFSSELSLDMRPDLAHTMHVGSTHELSPSDVAAGHRPLPLETGPSVHHPPVVDEQHRARLQGQPERVGGVVHDLRQGAVVLIEEPLL